MACMICLFLLSSCVINNPKPEDCEIVRARIIRISEGTSFDIVFYGENDDYFYINRGLEQGLKIDDLNTEVLNKTVTLHLAKTMGGLVVSEHISQLAVEDRIIFTEFD